MAIRWFPGHMATARKEAGETMAKTDVVIEVLDARLPGASTNTLISQLRLHRQRPCLKILNKSDAADPTVTAAWLSTYNDPKQGGKITRAVAMSFKSRADVASIPRLAASLAPHRDSTFKPVRVMVMGIPNVGKSTLINALLKRKVASTGDEPAITKRQSRHDLNDRMELVDTPGLMGPSIKYHSDGLMLAASHAIGRNAYIDEEVATFLAEILLARYSGLLRARYGEEGVAHDGPGVIEAIARQRGFRIRGGEPDYAKAALVLLQDLRTGVLGRISLETPRTRAAMLAKPAPAIAEVLSEGDDDTLEK